MEIKEEMQNAINKQINAELYSSYLYLAMAAYFDDQNLSGFAKWMKVQAKEEIEHAMKFYDFVYDRGGKVILDAIEKPKSIWESALDAFEDAYAHEQKVTRLINELLVIARKENDYATENMLQWFIKEQVEEEASTSEIAEFLKMAKNAPGALLMLDRKLAQRKD